MNVKRAESSDLEEVRRLYHEVIAQQKFDAYGPDWHEGVYPSGQDLREAIDGKEMYLGYEGGDLAGAFVLSERDDPIYAGADWRKKVHPEEACVIHLVAVRPSFRGRGVGTKLVRSSVQIARQKGKKAMHLDVVPGNLPADRMYRAAGFVQSCRKLVYYEDTGEIAVDLYELDLEKD